MEENSEAGVRVVSDRGCPHIWGGQSAVDGWVYVRWGGDVKSGARDGRGRSAPQLAGRGDGEAYTEWMWAVGMYGKPRGVGVDLPPPPTKRGQMGPNPPS